MLDSIYGSFAAAPWLTVLGATVVFFALGALAAPLWAFTLAVGVLLVGAGAPIWLMVVLGLPLVVLNVTPLRRPLVSAPLMKLLDRLKILPAISKTEQTALEAGTVWVDGELFSGRPDLERLASEPYPDLTDEERAFLDGPVEEVCQMTRDWEVHQRRDLPPEVWDFLKKHGFFGLIVPREYDGLGYSASANSAVVTKLASRSMTLAITVMVPNSLGPAELLSHYGTDEQKAHYLPRLARGDDIPCFALTEPGAGSDAGGIESNGVVFRGDDGELYIRLNWNKRYITLAAVSTLLGLAFKLHDPDELLSRGTDPGITCALVPTHLEGVVLGMRHDPMGIPFYNCPTEGHNVVVPVDAIIGGAAGAGEGWRMLMECLAAGRGISLPALAASATKLCARVTGAYAAVRKQFGLPIGKFEGVEEPLARIGAAAYTLEAARRYTCGGLDQGAKPAVVTAIAKYNFTEIGRDAVNDAMDIVAGAGISRGPRNLLAPIYAGMPISVTVEGANILTRTLMIFGQGAIRCHPYAYAEIKALGEGDLPAFDRAFWGHVGHVLKNGCRALALSLSRGWLARAPVSGPTAPYWRKLAWSSASFAFLADLAMASLGGDLKRKETITGRFSDIFSWMYLGTAVLRRFEAEGRREADLPFVHWSMQRALHEIQVGFDGLFRNLDPPGLGWLFRGPVAAWSAINPVARPPTDETSHRIAVALQTPGDVRDGVTAGLFLPASADEALGRLEKTFAQSVDAEAVIRRIKKAIRRRELPRRSPVTLLDEAVEADIITSDERTQVREAEAARAEAVLVDAFSLEEYQATAHPDFAPAPTATPADGDGARERRGRFQAPTQVPAQPPAKPPQPSPGA